MNVFTLVYEIGACCIYVVFMASNFKELTDYFLNTVIDIRLIMLIMLLPLILINWVSQLAFYICPLTKTPTIRRTHNFCFLFFFNYFHSCMNVKIRNLKYLAPLSTIGTFFTVASISIVCYYIFREPLTFGEGKKAVGSLRGFPFFFGNVLFALEAIAVVSKFSLLILRETK